MSQFKVTPLRVPKQTPEDRVNILAEAHRAQASYRALRMVQEAQDTPPGIPAHPGGDLIHSDPTGDAATYFVDRPVVRLG